MKESAVATAASESVPLVKAATEAKTGASSGTFAIESGLAGMELLTALGRIAGVIGAYHEAEKTYQAEAPVGSFDRSADAVGTFVVAVAGGWVDNFFAVMMPGYEGHLETTWHNEDAGPAQLAAGNLVRAFTARWYGYSGW